jgi:hypothetical protein
MAAAAERTRRSRRLGVNTRRTVLVTHIAAGGAWLGVDVTRAVLIGTAVLDDDPTTRASALLVLQRVTVWPVLVCGLVCLASGIVLGLGSRWGVLRDWWVAAKLALNLLLTALVPVALLPEVTDLALPPVVSPVLLLTAITLSVVKPWGRISRRRATQGE